MRPRAPEEIVQPFRRRECEAEGTRLRAALAAFAHTIPNDVWPDLPPGITDRNADCCVGTDRGG